MHRLDGRVAVVTGAASGIGLAVTEAFVAANEEGAHGPLSSVRMTNRRGGQASALATTRTISSTLFE